MENTLNKSTNSKKYIISSLKLNKYKFFPGETIEGKITIQPNKNIPGNDNTTFENPNISFYLIQNIMTNVNEVNFVTNMVEPKEESRKYTIKKDLINFENLKGTEIKESLEIPFKFIIPPIENENYSFQYFMPSFRFVSSKIKCFIIHSLSINISGESNFRYVIIFIKKIPNKALCDKENNKDSNNNEKLETHIYKENIVKICNLIKVGKINYVIKINQFNKYEEEGIPIEINLDESELKKVRVKNVSITLRKFLTLKKSQRDYNEKISEKMISILKDEKNKIIKDFIQKNKDDFPDLPNVEIQKEYDKIINECKALDDNKNVYKNIMKNNFTPPTDNELFKFEYMLDIVFELSNLTKDNTIKIPIDFYDGGYNNLNLLFENNNNKGNSNNDNNSININIKNNIEDNENEKNNKGDTDNGFVIMNKEDFQDIQDDKKNDEKVDTNIKNQDKEQK